ncbi:trihelix transcription factor GTL1-like isoform X2 [Magnolia sinica]|uniref:trihelix transcription factor GTL1-like isoform X2 n=1 Tax=Magnolia sinica TaxID=86752 RepID=UPI00265B0FD0|nr:trihelix transcription factor GTL1-like isoform X2 [Magnolia sinica]
MQQGGSQFGVSSEMPPFAGGGGLAEAASPISSRPPAAGPPPAGRGNFDELGPVMGSYTDDDTMGGEEAERGVSGNRWPRQETLALLKIRSEMDAVFRDATLKGPLWEDVSRKLAELGYSRSGKKCKEKFENVHKYYKRTKEGRAGRQDGKSYRFFTQLEALHSSSNTNIPTPIAAAPPPPPPPVPTTVAAAPPPPNNLTPAPVSVGIGGSNTMVGSSTRIQHPPPPVSAAPTTASTQINIPRVGSDLAAGVSGPATAAAAVSFSSNSSSSSDSDSEDEIEERPTMDTRRRKRSASGVSSSQKKMAFFEGLMKEVMEKQEAMQQRFLEAIEKREQDRMVREEAWKRQEMARLAREHEIMMQERAMAASRDAAVIAFLQKMSGQTIQITQPVLIPAIPPPQPALVPQPILTPPPQPQQSHHHYQPPQQQQPQQQQQQQQQHKPPQQSQNTEIIRHQPSSSELIVAQPEQQEMGVSFDTTSSSRWPKSEVLALIKLRSGLETRYQEAGPKGPLWEEISAGMHRLGFNRSSKRCKEKWENINKYFKKVKESNKKRPEDAKTCPYFHQLDALYRKKLLSGSGGSQTKQEQEQNQNQHLQESGEILAIMPPPPPQPQPEAETKNNNNNNKNSGDTDSGGSLQVQTSNGGLPPSFFEEGPMKKKTL